MRLPPKIMREKRTSRRETTPIKVYCLPDERASIEENAKKAGMSVGGYLREVGQGYIISGVTDYEAVRELVKINGDLGRLGGLLKMWLTDDVKVQDINQTHIKVVLSRIDDTQTMMREVIQRVIKPKKKF